MSESRQPFMWRAMTSVLIAASFLRLLISGAVLFISPPGRIANWTDWRIIGLSKHDWIGAHTWFAAVFVFAAVFRLVFNIRPLTNYFRARFTHRLGWRCEWLAALTICGGVLLQRHRADQCRRATPSQRRQVHLRPNFAGHRAG